MITSRHRLPSLRPFFLWGFLFSLNLSSLSAALTRSFSAATLEHPYLLDSDEIDGDPTTNRHTAETTFEVTINNADTGVGHFRSYRLIYRMVAEDGTVIDLENGDPNHPTAPGKWGASPPQTTLLQDNESTTLTFQARPDPVATLDSKTPYRVNAVLQARPPFSSNEADWTEVTFVFLGITLPVQRSTPPTQFLHFTNTASGDAEFNVRAGISNLTWTRTHALATDPAADGFTATVDVFVNRWDDFDAPIMSRNINFIADFDLIEVGSGNEIPLENDGMNTFTVAIFNRNLAIPPAPEARTTREFVADLKPLEQLESANETYLLRCTIRHEEDALGTLYEDTIHELNPEQLLHFNGKLAFGTFDTTFAQLGNVPPILAGSTTTSVKTEITIPANQGSLPNRPEYAFGDNTPLSVRLRNNGDAIIQPGSSQLVTIPGPPGTLLNCDYGGIEIRYPEIVLSTSGANAGSLRVNFPQGTAIISDSQSNPFLGESHLDLGGGHALDNDLCPVNQPSFTLGTGSRLVDESHPVTFAVASLIVEPGVLRFASGDPDYIHDPAFDALEALGSSGTIPENLADRPSNDRYLRNVTPNATEVRITLGPDNTSRLNTQVGVKATTFQSHFPTQNTIDYRGNSTLEWMEGEVAPDLVMDEVRSIRLNYYQTCSGDNCTAAVPPVSVQQIPFEERLYFVPGGGIHGPGEIPDGETLTWGVRAPGQHAHRAGVFRQASYYMPGYQLYASTNVLIPPGPLGPGDADLAPSTLLLSGFNRNPSDPDLHLSSEKGYTDGDGDLPGLNFDVTSAGFGGASRLAGNPDDYNYDLLPEGAKYYIRLAGVSGRQIATDGTFDSQLILHGFPCELVQFQLSFLDSDNSVPGTTSWVDGNIRTVGPYSNWKQSFTGLRFDCLGEPGEMTPNLADAEGKSLDYWNSTFDLKSLKFVKEEKNPGVCPKEFTAHLVAGAKTRVAYIDQDLYGALGFSPDGNLSTQTTQIDGYNSQLGIPANIPLDGPNQPYNLTTTSKLRFSNPTVADAPATGFVTFAATIDIPYFVDLQVQAITSATPGNFANFYLTPGWTDSNGFTFFNNALFDPDHRGFPTAGITFNEFRQPNESTDDTFLIKAEQKLFNIIDLRYPLKWDISSQRFSSMTSQKQELFVTQVEHQIEWMDAKFANISFGAKYDGLPQLKLSNYLNDQIDNAAEVITSEFNALAKTAVDQAIEQMEKMLEDSLEQVIDPMVDAAAKPGGPIELLHRTILGIGAANADYQAFRNQLETTLTDPTSLLYQSGVLDPILAELEKAGMATQDAQSFIKQLDDALKDVMKGIDAIAQGVEIVAGKVQFRPELPSDGQISGGGNFVPGLLFKEGDQRNLIENVVKALLREFLGPELRAVITPLLADATSALNQELNALLTNLDPTLDQIRSVLLQVRGVVKEIQMVVSGALGVADQIAKVIDDAKTGGLLADLINPVGQRAWAKFLQLEAALGIDAAIATAEQIDQVLGGLSLEEFVQLLKGELKAGIMGSEIVEQMQFLLRQTLYDLKDRITSTIQSVLDEISLVLKEVIGQTVGELEEQINPLSGQVSKYMGSGEITGYAEINGDSLRKLRLDAKMQFELPEEMSLHVYLEILAYSSEDNFVESGCLQPGEKAVEVRIGAQDVAIEWISDIRINLEVKMSLKDSLDDPFDFPVPNGVGGKFEMTDGVLNFQAFQVLEFGATIAVGFDETYIGAKARATFSNYEVAAGIFFGRTCTLEPLLFVDPDIGDVVTAGTTFTGAYVYGEVWLPISELVLGVPASCLFRIDAGVGAGAFFFLEGPTFGGKILLGVSGEALCLVNIRGEVKMIVASQAGTFRGAGTGKFSAKVGACPFCIKFRKSVKIKYDDGRWSID